MAISKPHYILLRELKARGVLPQRCDILEIGQATWYGDMDPNEMSADFDGAIETWNGKPTPEDLRTFALCAYAVLIDSKSVASIDLGGDKHAITSDLNNAVELNRRFGLVINHGTAEHIFNIANVFKVAHDHCEVGGIMIHESPWTGWVDHGFYSLQPTLFYDLAAANNYRLELFAAEHLDSAQILRIESREEVSRLAKRGECSKSLMLFVAFRKLIEAEFRVPQQGVYSSGRVSTEVIEAWTSIR